MIIIVCGMDRCGKDTQIKNLTKYLITQNISRSVHVLHYSSLPINDIDALKYAELASTQYDDMFKILDIFSKQNDISLILNRAHLGEMVYGYIYRNYNAEWIYDIEEKYKNLLEDIRLVVLIDSSLKAVTERDDGLSLSNKDLQKAKIEVERFNLAYNKSNIKHKILIDINNSDIKETENKIIKFVNNA